MAPNGDEWTEMMVDKTMQDLLRKPTLTIEEAGRVLGIKRSAAYSAVNAGTIPVIKVGKRKLVVPTARLREMLGLPAEAMQEMGNR